MAADGYIHYYTNPLFVWLAWCALVSLTMLSLGAGGLWRGLDFLRLGKKVREGGVSERSERALRKTSMLASEQQTKRSEAKQKHCRN